MSGDWDFLVEKLADRIAGKVVERIGASTVSRRLFTVDQAAGYLSRTPEAVSHMIHSGKLRAVRMDRRVYLDVKDLDRLIEDSKIDSSGFGAVQVKP
jgi:excisionase family DNA binding protein